MGILKNASIKKSMCKIKLCSYMRDLKNEWNTKIKELSEY